MALPHKFDQTAFENNLKRATRANAVLVTDLTTHLKDIAVMNPQNLPERARTAYQILVPMVENVGT